MDTLSGPTIADEVSCCLELFKPLCRRLNSIQPPSDEDDPRRDLSDEALTDALSRFNVWIGNIGALQRGRSSLDYRLGHADIRLEVLRLLRQLLFALSELWDIVSGVRKQQTWYSTDVSLPIEVFDDEDFSDDEDIEDEGTPDEGDVEDDDTQPNATPERVAESNQLYLSVVEAITSLFKLSMFIRKSARGNKFARSSAEKKCETQFDILHVRDRFPFASQDIALIERLGKANAQRRQWLLYRKRHREKLAAEISPPIETQSGSQCLTSTSGSVAYRREKGDEDMSSSTPSRGLRSSTTGLSSTVASTFYNPSHVELNVEEGSEAAFTETSYSESRLGDSAGTTLVPQPPPESADENPFECPYCFTILTITSGNSWTKHVHSDLASYVCTQENCSHPLFESRHQWFNHELEVHRQEWVCSICEKTSASKQEFEQHMKQQHSGTFLESQLSALMARAARPVQRILASACPLCDYDAVLRQRMIIGGAGSTTSEPITVKPQSFRSHLGRHLEQLALFVLPRNEVAELLDDAAHPMAPNDSDAVPPEKAVSSDDSGAEETHPGLIPNTPPEKGKSTADGSTMHPEAGLESQIEEITSESDEVLAELTAAPELAMGWLPPMNFTPPKEDFEADDIDWIPRREDSMFGGDLFTPGWVRGYGKDKEGFCGRCEPGTWHKMDDSSYENDLTYRHGIISTGIPLARPSSIRRVEGKPGVWEGYCDACRGWRILRTTKMGWNWFRHCINEHNTTNVENRMPPDQQLNIEHAAKLQDQDTKSLTNHIRMGDFSGFASLLEKQPGLLLHLDPCSRTPLHYAAEVGDVKMVQLALAKYAGLKAPKEIQAYINAKSSTGETALMLSVSQGHGEVAEILIANRADVDAISGDGRTALDRAAEAGYSRISEILIKRNANIENSGVYRQLRSRNNRTAQRDAKGVSRSQRIKNIVVNTPDLTPLMVAATEGDITTAKLLIDKGTDIEALSEGGETALTLAASKGHHNVIRILLSSGANINATTAKGWTTLMLVVRNKDERTVDFLLSCGADVNHVSPDRWTALAEATFQGQISIMRKLLRSGADTDTKSSHDWTPLMHAAYKGDETAIDILLEAGANMDVSSLHDETAILLAAAGGHTSIAQTLLNAGCAPEPAWASLTKDTIERKEPSSSSDGTKGEIGEADDRAVGLGWTPLMLACQNGLIDVVQMLLKANVNLEPKSPYRKTALVIARENGKPEISKLLEEHATLAANQK